MGRQFNFKLDVDGWRAVETRLVDVGALVLPYWSPSAVPEPLSRLDARSWIHVWLVRREDLPAVETHFVEPQDRWTIDGLRSPVIELSGGARPAEAIRSRLWFESAYFDENETRVTKPEDFIKWADAQMRWARRSLPRYFG